VQRCDCVAGCPACVGPVLAAQEESATTPKALALQVLRLLLDGAELDEETTTIDSELDALPEWSA